MKPHLDVKLSVTIPGADFIVMARGFLDLLINDSQYAGRWAVGDMKILEAIVREVRAFYLPRTMGRGQQDLGD